MLDHAVKDAPEPVGVTSPQLSLMIESALANALNQRLGPASGPSLAASDGQDHGSASMAQEPSTKG